MGANLGSLAAQRESNSTPWIVSQKFNYYFPTGTIYLLCSIILPFIFKKIELSNGIKDFHFFMIRPRKSTGAEPE